MQYCIPDFEAVRVFLIYFLKCPSFSTIQIYAAHLYFAGLFIKFKSSLLVRRVFVLNVTLSVAVLSLISYVHLSSFIIRPDETFTILQLLLIFCNLYVGMGVVVLIFSLSHFHIHFHYIVSSNFI